MRNTFVVLLCCLALWQASYWFHVSTVPARAQSQAGPETRRQGSGVRTIADIAEFEWVDKRCRMWGPEGDIDIDQTCLVVATVKGGVVVIPNAYNDEWLREIADQLGRKEKDRWIIRFYKLGGGVKD